MSLLIVLMIAEISLSQKHSNSVILSEQTDFNQNCPMLIFAMVLLRNLLNPISLLEEIEGTLIQPRPLSMFPPILICLVVTGVLAIFSLLKTAPLVS